MQDWRKHLKLESHPEGGAFRELHKSPHQVDPQDGRSNRSALTHIYFHLKNGEVSRFHRVLSDEIWHLYEGEGVILYQWREGTGAVEKIVLGNDECPHCHTIPAGIWQAAEPLGEEVLVGCTVGPGFEFDDFTLIAPDSPEAKAIRTINPGLEKFL